MTKSCSNAIIMVRFSTHRAFLRHNPEVQSSIGKGRLIMRTIKKFLSVIMVAAIAVTFPRW